MRDGAFGTPAGTVDIVSTVVSVPAVLSKLYSVTEPPTWLATYASFWFGWMSMCRGPVIAGTVT